VAGMSKEDRFWFGKCGIDFMLKLEGGRIKGVLRCLFGFMIKGGDITFTGSM